MKYLLFLVTTLLLIGLFSFKTAGGPEMRPLPTKLRITVIDGLGNPVEGAQVTLYASEDHYRNNTNPIDSATTDNKGRVTFRNLQPVAYYLDARKGDMNNNGEGVKTAPLEEGKLNQVNTVIE